MSESNEKKKEKGTWDGQTSPSLYINIDVFRVRLEQRDLTDIFLFSLVAIFSTLFLELLHRLTREFINLITRQRYIYIGGQQQRKEKKKIQHDRLRSEKKKRREVRIIKDKRRIGTLFFKFQASSN